MRKACRLAWRSLWLGAEVSFVGLRFAFLFLRTLGRPALRERAVCLHYSCRRVLRVFVDHVEVHGLRPSSGLLVCNHLSYLDILLLGSLFPPVFVSKSEVKHWPVFGWFGWLSGTVFVRRAKRGEVAEVGGQIRALLDEGHLVILFPEGTSSDGRHILPFKSSLLEPVVGQTGGLYAGCVGYTLADGVVGDDVCYWRDMTFFPHVVKLLSKQFVHARASFSEIEQPAADRKALARQLHGEVAGLRHGMYPSESSRSG